MSLDRSLKSGAGLNRHRNVLTKTERLKRLLGAGAMKEDSAHILGMPKVANRKVAVGKKSGKKTDEAAAAAGATPAAPAAAGAAKKAAPAAPAKKK
jgi:small basic protein (TIGR04137 family)